MADVRYASRRGRLVLLATVLGSGVAFLDSTVVNVALPRIASGLHTGFSTMQWVVDAYLLTLGALVLVGGAAGDLFGRRRIYLLGLVGFGGTSAVCAAAPGGGWLVAARAAQGVAGALLVPGSLALITASFHPDDRDRAIGAWSGLSGVATALGPFLGGWLIDAVSWRLVFVINVPLVTAAVAVTLRAVPESRSAAGPGSVLHRLDLPGAALAAGGLGLVVFPLIEAGRLSVPVKAGLLVAGAAAFGGFLAVEARRRTPMMPLWLFRSRAFSVANAVTFCVYGALGAVLFLLAVQLQTRLQYSALSAGAAVIPVTVLLLVFSPRVAALLPRLGARPLLTAGPVLAGAGLVLLARAVPGASYATGVLPGVLLFAVGMCLVVAPITATALGAVPAGHAGVASGVNNAVARVAGLVAVAVLPLVAGVHGGGRALPVHGYQLALLVAGCACAAGGLLSLVGLPRGPRRTPGGQPGSSSPTGTAAAVTLPGGASGQAQPSS